MTEKLNLLGAILTILIFTLCILIFIFRLAGQKSVEYWLGAVFLLTVIPLGYLLITAHRFDRSFLYFLQTGLMITFILVEWVLDYLLKIDFRHITWMTITYATLFFASTGGMIGVASLAGKSWTFLSVGLFFVMVAMAFFQRAKTGL